MVSDQSSGGIYRMRFGGRVALTLASWGGVVLALLAYGSNEPIHATVWAILSLLFYGTRGYIDAGTAHEGGER